MDTSIKNCLRIIKKDKLNKSENKVMDWIENNVKQFVFKYLDYLKENNLDIENLKKLYNLSYVVEYDTMNNTTFYYDLQKQNGYIGKFIILDNLLKHFKINHPNCIKYLENNKILSGLSRKLSPYHRK